MTTSLPSPFYRVAIKCLVFHEGKLLLAESTHNNWELPGGGWEHEESAQVCLDRELSEEIGVQTKTVDGPLFSYQGLSYEGYRVARVVYRVALTSHDFSYNDPDVLSARFFTKEEIAKLEIVSEDAYLKANLEKIFSFA